MTDSRIVVGVDDSTGARRALAWALDTAAATGAEVTAVSIATYPWAPAPVGHVTPPPEEAELEAACREVLDEIVAEVSSEGPWSSEPATVVRFGGRVGSALCEHAENADLLVVGQRGRGGFLDLRLGSVSEYCLHHAPVTLAIVPEHREPRAPARITVGIDGSDDSVRALGWAVEQGTRRRLPVVALMAWSWLSPPVPGVESTIGWDDERAGELLERVLSEHGRADSVERELVNDLPAVALVRRSEAGDLVVVGARGQSPVRSALAGSVSRQLAHHATNPIVVVR